MVHGDVCGPLDGMTEKALDNRKIEQIYRLRPGRNIQCRFQGQ